MIHDLERRIFVAGTLKGVKWYVLIIVEDIFKTVRTSAKIIIKNNFKLKF